MLGMSYSLYEQHYSFRIDIFNQIKFHKIVCPNASNLEGRQWTRLYEQLLLCWTYMDRT